MIPGPGTMVMLIIVLHTLSSLSHTLTHTHTHSRTHANTHTHTLTHTQIVIAIVTK